METPETAENSKDSGGSCPGEALKIGSLAITGLVGGVLLSRVIAGFVRMSLPSIVPVVFYQVLRKPAGSRKVLSGQAVGDGLQEDRLIGNEIPEPFAPKVTGDAEPDFGAGDQEGFPVFLEQDPVDPLSVDVESECLPLTEERSGIAASAGITLSAEEWAASVLDELEDSLPGTSQFEGQGIPDPEEQVTFPEGGLEEDTVALGDLDPAAGRRGVEKVLESGKTPPARQPHDGLAPVDPGIKRMESHPDQSPVVMDREVPADRLPDSQPASPAGEEVGFRATARESGGKAKPSFRRIPMDANLVPLAVAKVGGQMHRLAEEEGHDAFSLPFPGPAVAGVQAVANPFAREENAEGGKDNPGVLASVLLQEKRRPGKRLACGNSLFRRICIIFIVGLILSCSSFFAWRALRGTGEEVPGQALIIAPEANEDPGRDLSLLGGNASPGKGHDFPADVGVTKSPSGEKVIDDADLPSFRSLE